MDGDSMLSWICLAALLLLAAWFAAAETAAASVSRIRLRARAERGDAKAEKAMEIQDRIEEAINTLLIGTNITHISIATLTTVLVSRRWGASWVAAGTLICTVAVFFAGEMLPKSLGKRYSEWCAVWTAPTLAFLMRLFAPLSRTLAKIGEGFASLSKGDGEISVTEDELHDIIETMTDDGELGEERGELVHSALEFGDLTVERVFTPRVDMVALDVDEDSEKILSTIRSVRHSRLPVYEGTIDNIIGVLSIRRYICAYLRSGQYPELRSLLDETCFVHQSAAVDELLEEMTRRKLSLAVVTDNYGGTVGIVTVEDILEELVGEIWDEEDVAQVDFRALDGSHFEFSPDVDMEEVFDKIGYEDPEDTDWDHKPLGEWVYEQFDMIPRAGDSFTWHQLRVSVEAIEHRRILKLLVTLLPEDETEKGGEDR